MNVNINAVKFKADQKLEDFINEKVQKLSNAHDHIIGAEVMLRVEEDEKHENKVAEIKIIVSGYDAFAKKQARSFEEATDNALDAIRKQLVKQKEMQRG